MKNVSGQKPPLIVTTTTTNSVVVVLGPFPDTIESSAHELPSSLAGKISQEFDSSSQQCLERDHAPPKFTSRLSDMTCIVFRASDDVISRVA